MLVKMGYYNKHEIDSMAYENQIIDTETQESDQEVLERVTGYKFMGYEGGYIKLMSRAGEVISVVNRASLLDETWNFIFDIPG